MTISVDEYRPTRKEGTKEERIAAALEHRYDNHMVWHHEGGWTDVLEEELVQARPAHDDVKDALASAVEIAIKPKQSRSKDYNDFGLYNNQGPRSRFGGVRF